MKNALPIEISGLAELAQQFPDGNWRCLTVYIRKERNGAVVYIDKRIDVISYMQPKKDPNHFYDQGQV